MSDLLTAAKRAQQIIANMVNHGEWYDPEKVLDELHEAIKKAESTEEFNITALHRARFHKYVEFLTPLIFNSNPINMKTKEKLDFEQTFALVRDHAWFLALEPEHTLDDEDLKNE